jgi:hypothetical protein
MAPVFHKGVSQLFSHRKFTLIFLFAVILVIVMISNRPSEKKVYSTAERMESKESPTVDLFREVPMINLLGKSFDEIKQVLGEPEEQGYGSWPGLHYYMVFRHREGAIRFISPEDIEDKTVVGIFLGENQEILGVKVGMTFFEIKNILGVPDFGPELGLDNLYYMDYFFGDMENQIPEVFLSFSSDAINSPTHEAIVKWEGLTILANSDLSI